MVDFKVNHREPRLDALRGLMLVIMTIDHMPERLSSCTREALGFVSAAEGFVFLSGYVAGIVYSRALAQEGSSALWGRVRRRFSRIYLYHIATFAVCFALMRWTWRGVPNAPIIGWGEASFAHPLATLTGACLFFNQPLFLDVLPMYCLFVLAIPLVLSAARHGGTSVVVLISGLMWGAGQCVGSGSLFSQLQRVFPVAYPGFFNVFAWQFLFVVGLVLGCRRQTNLDKARVVSGKVLLAAYIAAVMFFALRHNLISDFHFAAGELTDRARLGPLRLLSFAAIGCLIGFPRFWPDTSFWTRALAYLGRQSLAVYCAHVVCLYIFECRDWHGQRSNLVVLTLFATLILCALYVAAWLSERLCRNRDIISPQPAQSQ